MTFNLIVLRNFFEYKRGDLISDKATIENILAGPNASSVVRTLVKKD